MNNILIDTTFNVFTDANGGDPDSTSPTLRNYHKLLWSKQLPNGTKFELSTNTSGVYLYHKSENGEFFLGSDAITHSYRNHKRKQWLITQIPNEVDELFDKGSTIGAFTVFPKNRIDGSYSMNQSRGINGLIDDRFDLTLECIRLYYLGEKSPLYDTIFTYKDFFNLFKDFEGYVKFFLFDDLIDDNKQVKFYLPFDNFETKPEFKSVEDYRIYKTKMMNFITQRNLRIEEYAKQIM